MSAEHVMIIQLIRMKKPVELHAKVNHMSPPLVGNEDWDTILEWEGVFNMTKITTTLSQVENIFTSSFGPVIQMITMKKLLSRELSLIDAKSATRSPFLVKKKKITEFTSTGKLV